MKKHRIGVFEILFVVLCIVFAISVYKNYKLASYNEETFMLNYNNVIYNCRNMLVEDISEDALTKYKEENSHRCYVMFALIQQCRFDKNRDIGPIIYYLDEASKRYTPQNPTFTKAIYDELVTLSEDMYDEDVSRNICDMFYEIIK